MRKLITSGIIAGALSVSAQQLSLPNAIRIAQENSYDGQLAKYSFMASYWTYCSFKAELRPSLSLNGGIANFDHSLVAVRKYEDGQVAYVNNNSMTNYLTLSLDQKIVATGGTVSLQSYLYRLDQFSYNKKIYNSQPLRINYTQPLRSFNELKWEKRTSPIEYQIAQKTFLTALQDVTLRVTELYFSVLTAQSDYKQSLATLRDRETLFEMAQKRLTLGTTTKSEVLQLELSLLNARVAVNKKKLELDDRLYQFFSYMRVTDYTMVELVPPNLISDLLLNVDDVLQKAITNSSHTLDQQLQKLEAEMSLAQARHSKGIQFSLHGEVGFSQTASTISNTYHHLRDNEIVGLTFSFPIFDWNVSRGKIKMAEARMEITRTRLEQAHADYIQELRKKVYQFNIEPLQCKDALRAQEIAEERYDITRRRFETGVVSVTDLNTAQQEMESAKIQYITLLQTLWTDYYTLQKLTLYDWIRGTDINVDFDTIINHK